jgi:hypothetical protein
VSERRHLYIRRPEHDRRIDRGDDFAGDAWLDTTTGQLVYVVVGHDPNAQVKEEAEAGA